MITRLLAVESVNEPTEIVIHINMLKEGWDVTNLYTIVPLRAANARTLIEQSIGRGLRLSYGKRTGVAVVDRLNIVAHDKFQCPVIPRRYSRSTSACRMRCRASGWRILMAWALLWRKDTLEDDFAWFKRFTSLRQSSSVALWLRTRNYFPNLSYKSPSRI
ncbi:hypothetical protein FACS189475_01790 [Betaproteobacteria bacterium]|nr:hypothetical protein FACS189475_01790 [Betaproteobacteria bacterium]